MITKPTAFEVDYMRSGAINHTIVELTDGSTTWYFSDSEADMQFGTTHVYGLLKGHSGIRSGVDLLKKAWVTPSVTIEIVNAKIILDSGTFKRPSDLLAGCRGQDANIYLLAGSQVSTISSDCLKRFVGQCKNIEMGEDVIRLILTGEDEWQNKILPDNFIGDVSWGVSNPINEEKKIPIVYGRFTSIEDDSVYSPKFYGRGLAVAIKISAALGDKYVISDHVCDALGTDSVYIKLSGLHIPALYLSADVTVTLNDSGYTTLIVDSDADAYAYFLINDASDEGTFLTDYNSDCSDYNRSITGAGLSTISDDTDSGAGATIYGGVLWAIDNIEWLLNAIPDDSSDPQETEFITDFKVQYSCTDELTADSKMIRILNNKTSLGTPVQFTFVAGSWQTSSDLIANLYGVNFNQIAVTLYKNTAGDGTPGNQDLSTTSGARIRCLMQRSTVWEEPPIRERGRPTGAVRWGQREFIRTVEIPEGITMVACDGLAYDTWIDSRSSNYSSGDYIKDPAGIIESVLRDRLSLTASEIDTTSFINAENTNVDMRINLHSDNEMSVIALIRQISEQSTFVFVWCASGRARLINLHTNYASISTDKYILYSHIIDGSIKLSKSDFIVNTLKVQSHVKQEEGNKYQDYDSYSNSTSVTSYGTRAYEARWPNIANISPNSVNEVAQHYINTATGGASNGDGIWANEHNIIEFMMPGFTGADLEEGDIIQFGATHSGAADAANMDEHLLVFGESWHGKKWYVCELQQYLNGLRVKAIEIFESS